MKCVKNGVIGTQEIFDTLRKLENNNMENNFKNREIIPCSIKDANSIEVYMWVCTKICARSSVYKI
ncbi:hypothetical protein FDC45_15840 [Clostridium botulinum]|uniref:Uncharacterized protein n=1 Tax=Clostridium botulinum TaxID=1491 RepID=A0A846JBX7_CLOBO|nr:hypothetical protein [Clostridium botulinum]ACA57503.1 hypothetical protein CLK_A0176 [Clostridium botulinum A3 str. Loch Maree]NFH65000.1 hypothetical protein [Clostridium botulinum]NFJ09547.1 hypothetical protein [Clostridium botulinum]NFK16516.1 hypothetical protein [Clostridium botulinum]NFM93481.1 hypothetical protein [Clostridium botulinum]